MLLALSSCAREETETTVVYYNLLDANGRQVNVRKNESALEKNGKTDHGSSSGSIVSAVGLRE